MAESIRVRLTQRVPVAVEHGLTPGREFDSDDYDIREPGAFGGRFAHNYAWVVGDAGERVKLLGHEFEVVG